MYSCSSLLVHNSTSSKSCACFANEYVGIANAMRQLQRDGLGWVALHCIAGSTKGVIGCLGKGVCRCGSPA